LGHRKAGTRQYNKTLGLADVSRVS
jgi:hypothetical protein